jgi:segregation and condensation protein B
MTNERAQRIVDLDAETPLGDHTETPDQRTSETSDEPITGSAGPVPKIDADMSADTPEGEASEDEASDADELVGEEYESLPAVLEALLFVADEPIAASVLARALERTSSQVRSGLDDLAEMLRDGQRGVRLQQGPDGAQLVTAPDVAASVEHFLGLEANRRLSSAALETLAIVAYRQPVTRHLIEQIRGVNSDGSVSTLRARGLIEGIGRAPGPGRPLLFATTQRFLEHFGLESPDELPPLPEDVELPPEMQGAQLALEATVEAHEEAIDADVANPDVEDRGDEDEESSTNQLTSSDEPVDEGVADDGMADIGFDQLEDDLIEAEHVEDDPGLKISDDLEDLSRAAGVALAAPSEVVSETSDGSPNA